MAPGSNQSLNGAPFLSAPGFLANTGIRFHADLLPAAGLNPSTLYPVVLPRPPPIVSSPYVPLPPTAANPVTPTLINYADVAPTALTAGA